MTCGPCKGCEERIVGCHSTCERYIEWKALIDLEREARNEETSISCQIRSAIREKWIKWRRNHR